ncbi:hypothetical protein H5410_030141 [Solanum commersonii]|uniref:TIR domain-containing protein n=1 Tax=Solanum commersonii TaxID=4109 RepID=A0A9J5YDF1_SOLCO|nr:hypothetical protein H5410_030141 [Solanum commersonii]
MASSSASSSHYSPQWKGVFTFQDDKRLEYGDSIPKELMKAIKDSKVSLVVFSKNYATSRWCLDELVKIMECKHKNGQIVIPIFYDVDPSHVRNQRESFAEAFAQHELKYKDDCEGMQKVQGWRIALTAASNLKGHDIRDGIESENIQHIINHISKLYKSAYSLFSSQAGMGGISKTTIATTIFHIYNLSGQFEAACIVDGVKENAKKNGLCFLQNILLSELLGEEDNYVKSKHVGKSHDSKQTLFKEDHSHHLEYLVGDICWFGNGSRVIVTTRNRDLIKNDNAIYDVVKHAKGLPLALKVWGSLLYNKDLSRWQKIFLDMACFFRGYTKREVMRILESCDFEAEYGFDVLIDKSLEFISESDTIEMHDLMQDMDSGEPSRLWNAKDFNEVMVNNTWTMAMVVIWFTYFEQIYLNKEAMENMKKLRIIYIDDGRPHRLASPLSDIDSKHIPNGSIECLSNNLRWVFWKQYPWESLSENFKPQRLVHLSLNRSLLHDLWTKRKITYQDKTTQTEKENTVKEILKAITTLCITVDNMDNEIQKLQTNEDNLKSKASTSQQHDYKNAELSRSEDFKNPELRGDVGKHLKTHNVCLNTNAAKILYEEIKPPIQVIKTGLTKDMIIPEDIGQQEEIRKIEIPTFYANKRIIGISTIIQELANNYLNRNAIWSYYSRDQLMIYSNSRELRKEDMDEVQK